MRALIELIRYCFDMHYEHKRDSNICKGCEIARIELDRAHETIRRLTTTKSEPSGKEIIESEQEEIKPIPGGRRRFVPYAVRQQMQNAADEVTLRLMQNSKKEIEEAEIPKVSNELPIDTEKIAEMERDILTHASATVNESQVNNG